jgi:hypothetical protein
VCVCVSVCVCAMCIYMCIYIVYILYIYCICINRIYIFVYIGAELDSGVSGLHHGPLVESSSRVPSHGSDPSTGPIQAHQSCAVCGGKHH